MSGFSRAVFASSNLIFVATWKFLVPFPGALDDCLQRLELRSPTEFSLDLCRRSDEPGRIAGSPWLFNCGDLSTRDFDAGCDYLADTRATSSTKIVKCAVG